jgi:hypothetical protein
MSIEGVSHFTFIVRDLDRMARFLCEGLGAVEPFTSMISTITCMSFILEPLNSVLSGTVTSSNALQRTRQ